MKAATTNKFMQQAQNSLVIEVRSNWDQVDKHRRITWLAGVIEIEGQKITLEAARHYEDEETLVSNDGEYQEEQEEALEKICGTETAEQIASFVLAKCNQIWTGIISGDDDIKGQEDDFEPFEYDEEPEKPKPVYQDGIPGYQYKRGLFGVTFNNVCYELFVSERDNEFCAVAAVDVDAGMVICDRIKYFCSQNSFQDWIDAIYEGNGDYQYEGSALLVVRANDSFKPQVDEEDEDLEYFV